MAGWLCEALHDAWRGRGTATLRDLGEVGWGVGLVLLAILGLGALSREFFGSWALAVTLGLFGYIALVFATIIAANLVAVVLFDVVQALRRRWHR